MGQNKELRNVLEKKNKEASEFVELITNLNGIVLHLKTQSSNLKADLSNSESNARSLATELENVYCYFNYTNNFALNGISNMRSLDSRGIGGMPKVSIRS